MTFILESKKRKRPTRVWLLTRKVRHASAKMVLMTGSQASAGMSVSGTHTHKHTHTNTHTNTHAHTATAAQLEINTFKYIYGVIYPSRGNYSEIEHISEMLCAYILQTPMNMGGRFEEERIRKATLSKNVS